MYVSDVIACRRELLRIGVTDITEHVKAASHKNRLGQPSMAGRVHGRDVWLRIIYPLRNQTPYEQQHAGCVDVAPPEMFSTPAAVSNGILASGYSGICSASFGPPSSRSLSEIVQVMFPPAESPLSAIRSRSTPRSAACSHNQRTTNSPSSI